jgi:hypothetical protein
MRAKEFITEDWNKVNRRDKTDGLSKKAVKAYRRENPGSKLQTAVTTKPSKLKPGSKAAKRRKSFCARMSGNKGPMKKPNGKPTPKALALRRWNCESVEEMVDMIIENMDHSKDNQAVPELKAALLAKKATLQDASEDDVYDIIDKIMTRIAKSHGISGQKLHDMWVKEYDQIPDTWIMKVEEAVDFEQMQPQQIVAVAQQAFAQLYPTVKLYGKSVVEGVGLTTHKGGEGSASAFAGSDTKRGAFYLTLNAYAEGEAMIVVIEDATAGEYKGAATAIIKSLFEAGERLYKTEQRELAINDNANTEVWGTIADRVGAEIVG